MSNDETPRERNKEIERSVANDIDTSLRSRIACDHYGPYSPEARSARQAAWDSHMETYGFCSNTRPI